MALQPRGMMTLGGALDPFDWRDDLLAPVVPFFGRDPLDVFNTQGTTRALGPLMRQQRQEMAKFSPILQADLIETENDFSVHVDLPGCDKDDLECFVENNVLHIKAERKHHYTEESASSRRLERTFGRMERAIRLPPSANTDAAKISFDQGVLTVSFPKEGVSAKRTKLVIT